MRGQPQDLFPPAEWGINTSSNMNPKNDEGQPQPRDPSAVNLL